MASTETISQAATEVLYQQHGGTATITQAATEVLYFQAGNTVYVSAAAVEVLYRVPWPRRFGPPLQSEG